MGESVNADNPAFGNEFNTIKIAWETGSNTGSETSPYERNVGIKLHKQKTGSNNSFN
jgi:hypothetical protein